jgi:GalNAc-alpha-(1->4)-GalNAc-alpha-(1->3)-diNAcBac-PP-undecaprenol alpha-1,4-N-acetyl-D-galactosaminyltransferase
MDNWKLVFLGDGPLLAKAKQYVTDLGICDKVLFMGKKKEVELYYRKAKVFAFTSSSEGFPNALGEAMSAGLASISFDCVAGPSELIDDGINGFLIRGMNYELYRQRLKTLMENQEIRNSFRVKAKEKMEHFSIEYIGEKFYQFLFLNNIKE